MKKCFVANVDGRTSEPLLVNLEKALKSNVKAQEQLDIINGDMFVAKFGDWNKESIPEELAMRMYKGFPALKRKKGTDQWYFVLEDGTKEFIQKRIYGDIPSQHHDHVIRTISKYYIDNNTNIDINYLTKDSIGKLSILSTVEDYVDGYLSQLIAVKDEMIAVRGQEAYENKVKNAETILKNKHAIKGGIESFLLSLGIDARKGQKDARALLENTITKDDVNISDGINIGDSALVNQKDNIHANIKAFLSSIQSVDGNGNGTPNSFLSTKTLEPFDNVYDALREHLTDLSAASDVDGGDMYTVMLAKMQSIKSVYPWMDEVISTLKGFNEDKKSQFVQAFNQTKLNLYVTTVEKDQYRVMNATETTSREYVQVKEWGLGFQENFGLFSPDSKIDYEKLNDILLSTRRAQDKFNQSPKNETDIHDLAEVVQKQFYRLGVEINFDDIDSYVAFNGGTEARNDVLKSLTTLIGYTGSSIKKQAENGFFSDGIFINPLALESGLKKVAKAKLAKELNIKDSVILTSNGVKMFAFTNPHHVGTKINEWYSDALAKQDTPGVPTMLEMHQLDTGSNNSEWLSWLNASSIKNDAKRRIVSIKRLSNFKSGLDSSFKSVSKNDGVSNSSINIYDDLNKSITKTLGERTSGGKSLFSTLSPADKSRSMTLEGFNMFRSGISSRGGEINVTEKAIDIGMGYFLDEFDRMKDVKFEIDNLSDEKKVDNYHTKLKNGLYSQVFESLSMNSNDKSTEEIRKLLYETNSKGDYIGPIQTEKGFTKKQREAVRSHIRTVISYNVLQTAEEIDKLQNINKEVLEAYGNDKIALAADYFMNGMISAVEYGKLFSGDPAYYKNLSDMIKRVPATYTDGLPLRLRKNDSETFNYSVVDDVKEASLYYQKIYDSLTDKSIAKAYTNVNITDAQGWITPRRWRFLKQRLGQWTPMHDITFDRMMKKQTLSDAQMKLAAQPLKGVYYQINNGIPIYFKYSQAVLMPGLVVGTALEPLYNKMTKDANGKELPFNDEIHEVVTQSGVKVGAQGSSRINGIGENKNTLAEDFTLNKNTAFNKGWKLQQDLPIKRIHDTKVGSQIQKNILIGISLDSTYNIMGTEMSGADAVQLVHDKASELSDIGKREMMTKFGIGDDGLITDKSALYASLLRELRDSGGNDNMINALEQETDLDQIPQMRTRAQNLFMNMMDKALTEIQTSGGSFIQLSPFGLESHDGSGIKIISKNYNGEGLLPPRISEDGKTLLPGQVMMPHSHLAAILTKLGMDISKMSGDDIMNVITPGVLDMVGYRIPNQGSSSNDALEVVGILPEGSGDSIIGYDGMPAKTGADFDIDKMFFMNYNLTFNKESGKIERETEGKKGVQNELVDIYRSLLLAPSNYDNLMRSVDGTFLKDSIKNNILNSDKSLSDMEFFGPVHQLRTKYEYMTGQTGVGTAANQLVDHSISQSLQTGLHFYLGIGNHTMVNGKKVTSFDDVNKNNKHSISDVLSAHLNANVDIANDNFITKGNHNSYTSTVNNVLVRAGVDFEFINMIMAQPVIKDLVSIVLASEGLTTKRIENPIGETAKARDLDLESAMRIEEGGLSRLKSLYENGDMLVPSTSTEELTLGVFSELMSIGKELNESVLTSKIDTVGNGGSPVSRMVMENRIARMSSRSKRNTKGIRGYDSKFKGTMLGTYSRNSIRWAGDVITKNNLFTGSTRNTDYIYDTINSLIGNPGKIVDVKLAKTIESNLYTYLYSGTGMLNGLDIKDINVRVPAKIKELKSSMPNNFFLQNLSPTSSRGVTFYGVEMNNEPTYFQNRVYNAWLDLYENPDTKDFAVDMVKYSFVTSGFSNNLAKFHNNIPAEIMRAEGFNTDFSEISREVFEGDINLEEFTEQFFKHSTEDNVVVPYLNKADLGKINDGYYAGFYKPSDDLSVPSPYYVKLNLKTGDQTGKTVVAVYKKVGESEQGDLYMRTYKLGHKYGKFSILEYNKFSGKDMGSVMDAEKGPQVQRTSLKANDLSNAQKNGQREVMAMVSGEEFLPYSPFSSKKVVSLDSDKKIMSDEDIIANNLNTIIEEDNNLNNNCK